MQRLSLRSVFGLIVALAACAPGLRAARELVSVDYFCPVTVQLTLKRELPRTQTAKGAANAVSVTRLGNRDFLQLLVAQYGGKPADWSIVAYAQSGSLDQLGDISVMARRKGGALYPIPSLDLATLTYLSANSSAYLVKRDSEGDLQRASFDQTYVVTWEHALVGGTFVGNGTASDTLLFGPVKIGNQSIRAYKPKTASILLNGIFSPDAGDSSVAELSIKIGAPRLVPNYVSSGGSGSIGAIGNVGGGGGIIIIETGGSSVSPN